MIFDTPLIFELGGKARPTRLIPVCDVKKPDFSVLYGEAFADDLPDLPDVSEIEVVRHFTNISSKNFGVENGPYPLGSCTMKYNPKINEDVAALPGFAMVHPLQPDETVQGCLRLYAELEKQLCAVTGMDAYSFQPSAGAHGEYTGLLLIKAYHEKRGDTKRNVILVPDAAHGTNPASAAMVGYSVREVKTNASGMIDMDAFKAALGDDVAGLMLTNPSTVGIFEENISEITKLVHEAGGQCYYDGANINAILMQARPGDMGFDVVHLNVHKSFSTPHGGGGPGAGPVGMKAHLAPFRPWPVVEQTEDGSYRRSNNLPDSVGKVRAFMGSFAVYVKTYAYILACGAKGLADVSEAAVANANYLLRRLAVAYDIAYAETQPLHEFVISASRQKKLGVSAGDIAKRLIDYGYHPPTVYFPLTVHEALMIEPTETEPSSTQ